MKNKNPKVSVIMPLYNVEKELEKSVNSILNQTYKNLEIIMCDDCSNDDTFKIAQDIAKKDKRIVLIKNDKNLKAGKTRNKCIEIATGKYIAIQDADDYSDLTRIEKQVDILENNSEYDFVSSSIYRYNEEGIWGEFTSWAQTPEKKDFLWGLPYVHGACLFKKEILDKIGGYRIDKDTARTEDFDLLLRLHIAGYRGYNIFEKLYYYNENIDAFMRRKYRYRIAEAKMRFNAYKKLDLMPIGCLYAIKPLIVGLIPRKIQYKLKQRLDLKQQTNKVKVLQVISRPHLGGVETMLMNVYRNINHEKLQFDFTNMSDVKGDYENEIIKLGGKIHYIKPIRKVGVIKYINQIRRLVKNNKYNIVHSHININNSFVLLGALLGGAKIRISHAHTTTTEKPNTLKFKIYTNIMKILNKLVANRYCACGKLAGNFLYGKKNVDKGKVLMINNALDIDRFKKYYGEKENLRKKHKLPINKKIIGHIGRFVGPVKNHQFIFEIILQMKKQKKLDSYMFVFVGDGEEIENYKKIAKKHKLEKNVMFYGTSYNIPELLPAFDYLILPSLYEGLPVVTIESQASGIKTLVSKRVTNEIDLGLGLIEFLGIEKKDIKYWIKEFEKNVCPLLNYEIIERTLEQSGYTIKTSIQTFYNLYKIEK